MPISTLPLKCNVVSQLKYLLIKGCSVLLMSIIPFHSERIFASEMGVMSTSVLITCTLARRCCTYNSQLIKYCTSSVQLSGSHAVRCASCYSMGCARCYSMGCARCYSMGCARCYSMGCASCYSMGCVQNLMHVI